MKKILGLLLVAIIATSCGSKKDVNQVSRDFTIEIASITNNEVKLKCTEGCAWTELAFPVTKYQPQGVDAYGMSGTINTLADVSDQLPDFKFSVEKTDNGAELRSIRDTGWNKLSISCIAECKEIINYDGIVR